MWPRKLDRLECIQYSRAMPKNVVQLRPEVDALRAARGSFVHTQMKAERWSIRQAALAIEASHSVLASRVKGETAFLAEELEAIAKILKTDPVDFYREYLAVDPNRPLSDYSTDHLATVTSIFADRGDGDEATA